MFFYIGPDCPIQLNKVNDELYLDDGWEKIDDVHFKGYSTDCTLRDKLHDIINGYQPRGIWCVIYDKKVFYPKLMGFHLYKHGNNYTNIPLKGNDKIKYKLELTASHEASISIDEASLFIEEILLENTQNFIKFNSPENVHIIFTGGLDSATSLVLFNELSKNYTLEIFIRNPRLLSYSEYDSELITHMRKMHWAYEIYRYKKQINWLVTGFYSERLQLRAVNNTYMILNYLKKDKTEILKKNDYLYHWLTDRADLGAEIESTFRTEKEIKDACFNLICTDMQYWHLDNNFGFSPFYDIRIPEIIYRMSIQDILLNAIDGVIQKKIIKKCNPICLNFVSTYKNKDNYKNLIKNIGSFYKTFSDVKIDFGEKFNRK